MSNHMQPGSSNGRVVQNSPGNKGSSKIVTGNGSSSSTSGQTSGTNTTIPNSVPSGEVREYLFKLLIIGELGTGKTSFIKRYVHQFFSTHYRATVNYLQNSISGFINN